MSVLRAGLDSTVTDLVQQVCHHDHLNEASQSSYLQVNTVLAAVDPVTVSMEVSATHCMGSVSVHLGTRESTVS